MSETSAAGRTSIPINGHDVHCKARYPQLTHVELCLWCTVIRVVRDEEQVYALSAYNNGYKDGYGDSYMKGYYDGATRSGKYHNDLVEWIGDDLL